jgi:F-type H+-transporting ATPase subunit b
MKGAAMVKRFLAMCVLLTAFGAPLMAQAAGESNAKAAEPAQPGLIDLNWSAVIWVLVIFTIVAIILYRTAWKNVLIGLKGREDRIRRDIADAEAARAKAEATLRDYNQQLATAEQKARDLLNQAASDAEKLAAQIRTRAQQDAEETRERALRDIETARDNALTEIYQQTAELATKVAEKIIRRNLNADDQRELVNQSLQELQTVR